MQRTFTILSYFLVLTTSVFGSNLSQKKEKVLSNGYTIDYGHSVFLGAIDNYLYQFPKGDYSQSFHELDSIFQIDPNVDYLKEIAFIYTGLGDFEKALNIYSKIEKLEPFLYTTASNVSFVYEYMGEYRKALTWFDKAKAIQPKNSAKSDFIRLKILEAKIKGDDFIKKAKGNFYTAVNFGKGDLPIAPKDISLIDLKRALEEQISHQLPFSEPIRPLLGALYFELANIEAILEDAKVGSIIADYKSNKMLRTRCGNAYVFERYVNNPKTYSEHVFYTKASDYGYSSGLPARAIAIKKRNDKKAQALAKYIASEEGADSEESPMKSTSVFLYLLGGMLILGGLLFFIFRGKKKEG